MEAALINAKALKLKRARRRALGFSLLIGIFGGAIAYLFGSPLKPLWLTAWVLLFGLMWFFMVYRWLLGYCKLCIEEEKKLTYTELSADEQELEELRFDPVYSHLLINIHHED